VQGGGATERAVNDALYEVHCTGNLQGTAQMQLEELLHLEIVGHSFELDQLPTLRGRVVMI
jgi:hypothetical protein